MKIDQQTLFKQEKQTEQGYSSPVAKKESSFNPFDIHFALGNNKNCMKDDGIAILRILGSRFSKNALSNRDGVGINEKLMTVLSHEVKIKKGHLPLELSVMDTLFSLYVDKK